MLSADGMHGFGGVQAAFVVYLALTLCTAVGLWWLGLSANLAFVAFVIVGALLLIPFWPLFAERYPAHSEA